MKEALGRLANIVPAGHAEKVVLLQGQLKNLDEQVMDGVISTNEEDISRNKIRKGILKLVQRLETEIVATSQTETGGVKSESSKSAAKIYFSYAWGDLEETEDSREKIVDQLYDSLTADGFQVLRDKMNIAYGGLISQFMTELGAGDLIVVFISDKYARSPYCMFELYEIARNNKLDKELFRTSILPVPVERIRFDEPDVLEVYFQHWEEEVQKWENLLTRRMQQISEGQSARYHKVKLVSQNMGQLSDWLADINSSSVKLLSEDNFVLVKDAIRERFEQLKPGQ